MTEPPLRILVATDQWRPDASGGAARSAAGSAQALARLGHGVTVLAPTARARPRSERPAENLTIRRVLPRRLLPQTLSDPVAAFLRGRDLRPDVLLAHQATVAAGLAAAYPDIPLVLSRHGSPAAEARYAARTRPARLDRLGARTLMPVLGALDRRTVGRAARIVVPSEYARSVLAAGQPDAAERTTVVPCGVDTQVFTPGDGRPDGSPLLFAARRLEPHAGVGMLLRALPLLPGVRLVIAGEGRLGPRLRMLAAELELGDRVQFVGLLEDPDLAEWYRAADLAVLPSIAFESFGNATVEALACGTPVVGTPVGGTPELLAPLDRRLVAARADAPSLAAALATALGFADEGFRARCRAYAVERFSWEQVAPAWDGLLREAAG